MAKKTEANNEFRLPAKKVLVKPIIRRGKWLKEGHSGNFLYDNTQITMTVPLNRDTGRLVNPLTKEEQAFFENPAVSGQEFQLGDLNPYKTKDNFWQKLQVRVKKAESIVGDGTVLMQLDLSDPMQYLHYAVLRSNSGSGGIIAPSWDARFDQGSYRLALVEEGYDQKETTKRSDLLTKAYVAFDKMKSDREGMYDFLNIYYLDTKGAAKPSNTSKTEFYVSEIQKIVDKDIEGFLNIIDNKNLYEEQLLVHRGIDVGAIVYNRGEFELPDGRPVGGSLKEVIKYFQTDKNQEERIRLMAQIENS